MTDQQEMSAERTRASGTMGERVAVIENTISGKNGLVDQVSHLHDCVETIKATVWKATGLLAGLFVLVKFVLGI